MTASNSLIYLDNAATSFPKPQRVINAVQDCICHYCGNPGRSGHRLSILSAERVYECRELLSLFLDYPYPERISFTQNATAALNIAIKGLIPDGAHCIISDIEHNSVLRPLHKLKMEKAVSYDVFDSSRPLNDIEALIRPDTKYLIFSILSNVTGFKLDINELSKIASRNELGLIIDASQYVGHYNLSLSGLTFDAICMPGHKALMGIQGSGVLVLGDKRCNTLTEGGSGSDSFSPEMPILPPERYEAGTLSTPAIASLLAGVGFIMDYGIHSISKRLDLLTDRLRDMLSCVPQIKLYACESGIAAFSLDGIPSESAVALLDSYGICVRGGIHCAPLIHNKMKTNKTGLVRASLSLFNKESDIDRLYSALRAIVK